MRAACSYSRSQFCDEDGRADTTVSCGVLNLHDNVLTVGLGTYFSRSARVLKHSSWFFRAVHVLYCSTSVPSPTGTVLPFVGSLTSRAVAVTLSVLILCWKGGKAELLQRRQTMRMYASASRKQQPSSPQPQDKYGRFEQWLRENGAKFDLVSQRWKRPKDT